MRRRRSVRRRSRSTSWSSRGEPCRGGPWENAADTGHPPCTGEAPEENDNNEESPFINPFSCPVPRSFRLHAPPLGDASAPLRAGRRQQEPAGSVPRLREGPRQEDRRPGVRHRGGRAGGRHLARLLPGMRQDGGELRAGLDTRLPDHASGAGRDLRVPHKPDRPRASLWPVRGSTRADAGDVARRLRTVLLIAAFATFASGTVVAPALFGETPAPARTATASAPGVPAAAYTLSPEKYEKAVAYSRARYRLHFIAAAW